MIHAARPQSDYDRALDLYRWRMLGVPLDRRDEPPTMIRCRAHPNGAQCRDVATTPPGPHAIYCSYHYLEFLKVVAQTQKEQTDGSKVEG